ncbi:MAG: tetratricopeptide repeat protein, partial [Gemmatimonadales bacterium]
ILKALARVPADRFATAAQFEKALAHAAAGGGVGAGDIGAGLRRHWWGPAAVLAVILAIGTVLNVDGVRGRLVGRTPAPVKAIRMAVLPFENRTGDPAQEYFSDGLTEEMITQLGRLHPGRLGVIARTSAMRYKHTDKPIDQIGRELGVNYILEGGALRESGRVRITVRLIRTSDQTQLWADSYERDLTGILSLQSDVARGVAKSLALALLPDEEARLAEARPVDPEAYEAYLKGREHINKLTAADIETAEKYFQLALHKDPEYALAHTGISMVWIARQQMQYVPPREAVPQAKAAAERALALDSTLPEAHFRLAAIKTWSDWDWPGAEREFQRAIDLDPNYAEARAFYSHFLMIMRRPAEAMRQIKRALELDPLSELFRALYGHNLINLGRYDEAIAEFTSALRTAPGNPVVLGGLANAYYHKQMYVEALAAERSRWAAGGDRDMVAALDRGHAEAGYRGAMHRAAETLAAKSRATNTAQFRVAQLYLRAGDQDQALAWLEKSYEARDPNMPYIGVARIYDPLRGDARFQDLLRRMKLPS